MTKGNPLLFLIIITIVSVIIRFYQLGSIPNGLSTDEADIGYNAYSIIRTDADVYGRKYPLFFQSLDDYKPGFVFYLTIPAIAAFGLNDFSVRLAPAIFGIFTPALMYVLIKLLYPNNNTLPYLSAVLTVFAPWNIALSRAMIQYIPVIFFYLLFFTLFIFAQKRTLKAHIKFAVLISSFFVLSITLYVYYASFIYLPLILAVTIYLYRDFFKKNLKIFSTAILILTIFSLPAIKHYSKEESKNRLNSISIFTPDITLPISIEEMKHDIAENDPVANIIHNRRFVYFEAILGNYFDYFNPDYLFVNANKIRYFYVHNVGLFYLLELPFALYGFYVLLKRRKKADLLILNLAFLGPAPAMITTGSPLPHRALLLLIAVQLISAIGVSTFFTNNRTRLRSPNLIKRWPALVTILVTIYAISIYFFLHQYFIHAPREFILGGWFPGIRDSIPVVNAHKSGYDKVIFTWSQERQVPPVYFLFYNKIDPRIIQSKAAMWTNEPPSYRQIYNQIGNIDFRPIYWEKDKDLKNTLFIGYPKEFTTDINIIDKTYLPNGNEHFLLVATD